LQIVWLDKLMRQKKLGSDTTDTLHQQTEQLARTEDQMKEIDMNLKEATKLIRSFARRTMTDKLVLGFICLIALAIIFIIIWSILKPGSTKVSTPSDFAGVTSTT